MKIGDKVVVLDNILETFSNSGYVVPPLTEELIGQTGVISNHYKIDEMYCIEFNSGRSLWIHHDSIMGIKKLRRKKINEIFK